ncbi:FecR family protein [Olivibacter ginsenosidimutans]|uniref:FecR family protein n=1 Tax=Olivibacter ginsenosidimutans TaxID=1176537 RepID=A0ABP9AF39_9SPHI
MAFDREKIKQWYIEKAAGVISTVDEEQLATLLSTDEEAQQFWQKLEQESQQLGLTGFMNRIEPVADLAEVKQQLDLPRSKKRISFRSYAAIAALFITVFGVYFIWQQLNYTAEKETNTMTIAPLASTPTAIQLISDDGQSVNLNATSATVQLNGVQFQTAANEISTVASDSTIVMSTLSIPIKETYRIVLPDGSKVWLNAASKLRFPSRFNGENRKVYLEGEGYFEVRTDPKNPFIVETASNQVQVLGTRFNLKAYPEQATQTALVDGSVRVIAGNDQHIQLKPGYAANYHPSTGFKTVPFDVAETLAWMEGIYYFHDASLVDLAEVITHWYGYSVTFDRTLLARQRITGLMEKDNISNFLTDLSASTGIQYQFAGNVLYLK